MGQTVNDHCSHRQEHTAHISCVYMWHRRDQCVCVGGGGGCLFVCFCLGFFFVLFCCCLFGLVLGFFLFFVLFLLLFFVSVFVFVFLCGGNSSWSVKSCETM